MISPSELMEEFHSFSSNKEPQTLKQLNLYIAKVKGNIQNERDLHSFVTSIQTKNAFEHAFKIEILLQLRSTDQLLEVLKTADVLSIKKIVKNKRFLADAFANMRCEIFFNTIVPYVAYATLMKILNRLPTVLNDTNLAREYFDTLLLKYGVNIARKVLLACDVDYIKYNVEKFNINLTSDELLILARKDKDFLRFYFEVNSTNERRLIRAYPAVVRFIGETDADFFWELYEVHKFNKPNIEIRLGEHVFDNLFSHDEKKATDREICVDMFEPRVVFNALIKRDKLHILLMNFCHGDEDEFYEIYCQNDGRLFYSIHEFLERAPKYRYFYYLNKAYNLKFGKNLVDNPRLFDVNLLKLTPKNEREVVLDVLTLENPNLFYLYGIEKSIPILKEKLKTGKDNIDIYLDQLYQTCRFNKDENMLSEILNYILQNHRHNARLLNEIVEEVVQWQNSEKLKPEIWKVLNSLTEIVEYSDEVISSTHFDHYLRHYIINCVNNNVPFGKFFRVLLNRKTEKFMQFGCDKNNKLFYITACKLINYMYKKKEVLNDLDGLLEGIREFNCVNEKDRILLVHYAQLLEMVLKLGSWEGNQILVAGTENNEHSCFHDWYWRRLGEITEIKFPAYVEHCPEEFLENIPLIDAEMAASLSKNNFKHFTVEMKQQLSTYCLDILKLVHQNTDRIRVAIILLSLVDTASFFNVIKLNLTSLHEIDDEKHSIKKTVLKCFSRMAYTPELFPFAIKIYEEYKHKQYLGPIKSYFSKTPVNEIKILIKSFSDNPAAHLRKLSLILTQDSLNDLYELMTEMLAKETDVKVKRTIYKKAFLLFLQNQDESHWMLLEKCIESGGVNPKYVTEFWSKLSMISPEYCEKFVVSTLKAVLTAESSENKNWKEELLVHLPKGIQDKLSVDLLMDLLKEIPFYSTKSRHTRNAIVYARAPKDNYHLESLFYTSDEKQQLILEFILKELEEYVAENWNDFPKKEVFSNVYEFMRAFCKYTFRLKPTNGIVEKFYTKWISLFQSYPQSKFLMLEFLNAYSESRYVIREFCKRSKEILKSYVAKYGEIIFELYRKQLDYFVDAARIDKFEFYNGLIGSDCDPLTYCVVANILPEPAAVYYTEQCKLKHLRDILMAQADATVKLHFSTYFDEEHHYHRYCNEVIYVHRRPGCGRRRGRKVMC